MEKYIINHVTTRDINSGIFKAIINYFREFSGKNIEHIESITPLSKANVYHYHRPHLEKKLLPNSVCTVHHDLNDTDTWHSRHFFIPRYKETNSIICLNNTQKNILITEHGIDAQKIHVIPHGYNEKYLFPFKKKDGKFVLGISSRRYGRRVKGEAYLLELVKRLDPEIIKFILVGEERSIDAFSFRRLGFEVDAYERLPYKVFNGFYSEINALLMCSSYEGGPANIPEALATNTPIFSSRIAMPLDYISHGNNGFFLTLDPNEDAKIIMNVAKDEKLYKKILNACEERRKSILTWRDSVSLNNDVYMSVINNFLKVEA